MGLEHIVFHLEAQAAKVFDCKHRCCAGISLAERMYLPEPGNESRQMIYNFSAVKPFVSETFLQI